MADATAFCWAVVKFDVGAAEAFALLDPELVAGAVDVVAGGEECVVVGAADRVTVFTTVTVCAGGAAPCCVTVTVLTDAPHPAIKSPITVVTTQSFLGITDEVASGSPVLILAPLL